MKNQRIHSRMADRVQRDSTRLPHVKQRDVARRSQRNVKRAMRIGGK